MVDVNEMCVNAVKMNKKNPKTFEIPSQREIENAQFVKICLDNERFWVKVESINFKEKKIVGTVDNDVLTNLVSCGDEIMFNYDKVYSVLID